MKRADGTGPNRIGITAAFGRPLSVHSRTVFEAVRYAISTQPMAKRRKFTFYWISDSMSRFGGMRAARHLVSQGVEVVVGHYSSSAAHAARSLYRYHGIPLLLPAASDDRLTERAIGSGRWPDTFRLCATNSALGMAVVAAVNTIRPRAKVRVLIEDSRYGLILGNAIKTALASEPTLTFVEGDEPAHCCVVAGHFENALQSIALQGTTAPEELLILVDDGVHPSVAELLPQTYHPRLYGVAVTQPVKQVSGRSNLPGTVRRATRPTPPFFIETAAALEIAMSLTEGRANRQNQNGLRRRLARGLWKTSLGRVCFSATGDNRNISFSLWAVRDDGFRPTGLLEMPRSINGDPRF